MKLQKIASLVLALIMIFSLGITAFADETTPSGSITINGVSSEATYEIYKLLDLESYDIKNSAYSYKVNSAWIAFFASADALSYVAIDNAGYVTWKAAEDDATVAAFAKLALAFAKDNGISPVKSSKNEGEFVITETTGVFSGLELGYYLVDTNVGALCGLTTTNPAASLNAKNGRPTIDKQVQEDLTSQWGKVNSADIGQTVNFRTTIHVHAGAQNYVLHDIMDAGFTFTAVEKIELVYTNENNENITKTLVEGTDYTVVAGTETEGTACNFEVVFSESFCNSLRTNNRITVYYSAMLNRNAVIAGNGNLNTTWLSFGETFNTEESQTTTYTYGVDIVKTDSQNTLLDGAEFKIYDSLTGGNEVKVVLMDDGVTYRRARADEEGVSIVVKNGIVRVVGFDNGTYYLEETKAPDGYNKLTARQAFTISDANLDATFNDGIFSTGSGVHVVNKTGSMLPETGGIGTTLFYVAGGLLVGGAVVALISKKRMSSK